MIRIHVNEIISMVICAHERLHERDERYMHTLYYACERTPNVHLFTVDIEVLVMRRLAPAEIHLMKFIQ